jgi:hypothetical protein
MAETNEAEFEIQVHIADANDEELDHFTRQLRAELRELDDVESAELLKEGAAPEGTMSGGDVVTIGSIVVSALPTLLPAIVAFVQEWSSRAPGRTIKFKYDGIEYEGSREDLEKILDQIKKGKKKKK